MNTDMENDKAHHLPTTDPKTLWELDDLFLIAIGGQIKKRDLRKEFGVTIFEYYKAINFLCKNEDPFYVDYIENYKLNEKLRSYHAKRFLEHIFPTHNIHVIISETQLKKYQEWLEEVSY